MQIDREKYEAYESGKALDRLPYVRVYQWDQPTITCGHNQEVGNIIARKKIEAEGWACEKRPTGGGVVFHEKGSISFTLIMKRSARKVDETVFLTTERIAAFFIKNGLEVKVESKGKALRSDFCQDYLSRHEISLNGEKFIGLAQRFGKKVVLQQGTIFGDISAIKEKDFCRKLEEVLEVEINN